MKVLFLEIATERDWALASIGPACLSAYLRARGHTADLHVVGAEDPPEAVAAAVRAYAPDLVGLSMTTRQWLRGAEVVAALRERVDVPVVAGGLHPTFAAEQVLASPGFDCVVLGEGEEALLELLEHLGAHGLPAPGQLRNVQVRGGPRPTLRPPIPDLDTLPWMARDMLNERHGVTYMVTQRGCPFLCTYCAARMYNEMYTDYGRRRSHASVLDEIADLHLKGATWLIFLDDTFTINPRWVKEFCDLHAQATALPFSLHARAETMSDDMIEHLARAGCRHITYGVESGSERVRRDVMKRHITNGKLIDVFERTRAAGILTTANYILGVPGETLADIELTLELHEQLLPDDFGYFVFYPYPGTPLFHVCKAQGLLPEDWMTRPANHRASILNLPDLSPDDLARAYDRFTEARTRNTLRRCGAALDEEGREAVRTANDRCAASG